MIFLLFVNLYVIQKSGKVKVVTIKFYHLWLKKRGVHALFKITLANEQLLWALFLQNGLCCYSFLYRTSLIINLKSNSTPKFVSIFSYTFITRHSKLVAWEGLSSLVLFIRKLSTFPLISSDIESNLFRS